jgi:hypothetical protein
VNLGEMRRHNSRLAQRRKSAPRLNVRRSNRVYRFN